MVGSAASFFSQQQGVKSPREWNRIRRIQEMAEQAQAVQTRGQELMNQTQQANLDQIGKPQTKTVMQNKQMWEYDVGPNGAMIQGSARLAGQPRQQQAPQQPQYPPLDGRGPMRATPMPSYGGTPQVGFNQPPVKARHPSVKAALAEGLIEGSPEFIKRVTELNNPKPAVSINNQAQGEEAKGLATLRVADVQRITEDAYNARDTLQSINQMDAMDLKTGAFEPLKATLGSIAMAMGMDKFAAELSNVAGAQGFNAISFRMVNAVLNQAKGPQTEGDAQRARSTIASLGNEGAANDFIIATMRANALRKIEKHEFYQDRLDGGKSVSETRKEWKDYMTKTPNLSEVGKVSDPDTGLPVYFYQFKERAIQNRPNVTQEEIVQAWRQANG